MKIYGISGLGADKRVFNFLTLDAEFIPIDWIEAKKNEPLHQYALRLSKIVDTQNDFILLGISFGGLVATEISKFLNPKMTILISSAETKRELPSVFRFLGKLRFIRWIPSFLFNPPRKIAHFIFGTKQKKLLNSILNDTDLKFAKWAINQLLIWENEEKLKNVIKISGTKDKLIPPSKNYNGHLIKGGEHFMIVDCAEEISYIINEKLKSIL